MGLSWIIRHRPSPPVDCNAELLKQLTRIANVLERPPKADVYQITVTIGQFRPRRGGAVPGQRRAERPETTKRRCPVSTSNVKLQGPSGELMDTGEKAETTLHFDFVKNGRPQQVDPNNPPRFEFQGESFGGEIRNVQFHGNSLDADFVAATTAGHAQVLMLADPKLGDGDTELSVLIDWEWTDEMADNINVTIGAFRPRSQPNSGGIDPNTGQPYGGGTDPATGQPYAGGVDPNTGQPYSGGIDPNTGRRRF